MSNYVAAKRTYIVIALLLFCVLFCFAQEGMPRFGNSVSSESIELSADELNDLLTVLTFMNIELENLPDNEIEIFACSPLFDKYREVFTYFSIVDGMKKHRSKGMEVDNDIFYSLVEVMEFMTSEVGNLPKRNQDKIINSNEYARFLEILKAIKAYE
jgi:hypothetical protein